MRRQRNPERTFTVHMDDTDCLESMKYGRNAWLFIEIIDMDSACGRDNEGRPTFAASISLVDLDVISLRQIWEALESSGWDGFEWSGGDRYDRIEPRPKVEYVTYADGSRTWNRDAFEAWEARRDAYRATLPLPEPLMIAETCKQYGHYAPLWDDQGNGRIVLRRLARRAARELASDAGSMESAMERPVNKIGSTAREFMQGDIFSAMQRGAESGDPESRLMAKMYGIPDDVVNDARPADWLPYLMGYGDGLSERDRESDPDVAPEYHRGFDRGVRVRLGEVPAPGWIHARPGT